MTEKTLRGSIQVLTEILSLIHPLAFGKALRLKRIVIHVARLLKLPDIWQLEVAAMLSQIGCITLTSDVLHKVYLGDELTPDERALVASHPNVAGELLAKIPRLESIAEMITRQQQLPDTKMPTNNIRTHALSIDLRYDRLLTAGKSRSQTIKQLRREISAELSPIIDARESMPKASNGLRPQSTTIEDMKNGMVLDQDVKTVTGIMLIPKGQEITTPVMKRLMSFAKAIGAAEPIKILAPVNMV